MESLLQDLRVASRSLFARPSFTLAAVLTIALGIGATTTVFSVVFGIVLRPLPYPESGRIMKIWPTDKREPGPPTETAASPVNAADWKRDARSFESMAVYSPTNISMKAGDEPQVMRGARAGADFFHVFGRPMTLGREFTVDETTWGGPRAVIISYGVWQELFGGDTNVIGRTLEVAGEPIPIVGVAPERFSFPENARLWIAQKNNDASCGRGCVYLNVVGRLRDGVTVEAANQELRAIAARMEKEFPGNLTNETVLTTPLQKAMVGEVQRPLFILLGAILMVLLIACANVANLMLVRGTTRVGEIAVRATLGASRLRLVRQLMTESLLLATFGAAGGVLLANWMLDAIKALSPGDLPRLEEVAIGGPGLLFALVLTAATAVAFGLIPSLQLTRVSLAQSIRQGGRGDTGPRSSLGRSTLLAAEVGFSVVLLLGAGLLLRSFLEIQRVQLGFTPANITHFTVSLPASRYTTPERGVQFFDRLRERLLALPGVESVSVMATTPLSNMEYVTSLDPTDRPPARPGEGFAAIIRVLDPYSIPTLGIRLAAGRNFESQDRVDGAPVIIINEAAAKKFWPGVDPIGKQVEVGVNWGYEENAPRTVIGVIEDIRSASLTSAPEPEVFVPRAQTAPSFGTLLIRTRGESTQVLSLARAELHAFDANLPMIRPGSLAEDVNKALAAPRFYMTMLVAFSIIAILLAAVGIYGVVAYLVTQRTREIGVRLALGANISNVVRLVLWQGMRPALLGVGIGLFAAFAYSEVLATLLYEVQPTDLVTYLTVPAMVVTTVVLACVIPAQRASRTSPAIALRSEQA